MSDLADWLLLLDKNQAIYPSKAYNIDQTIEKTTPGGVKDDLWRLLYHGSIFAWVNSPNKNAMSSKTKIQKINLIKWVKRKIRLQTKWEVLMSGLKWE